MPELTRIQRGDFEVSLEKPVTTTTTVAFEPSPYQSAIFDKVRTTRESLIVKATAGSGKSTTLIHAARLCANELARYLAFGKDIVTEIKGKLPDSVEASTCHSAAFREYGKWFYSRYHKRVQVDDKKLYNVFDALQTRWDQVDDVDRELYQSAVVKLVEAAQNAGLGVLYAESNEAWNDLIAYYNINDLLDDPDASEDRLVQLASWVLSMSNDILDVISYNDMLYLTLLVNVRLEQFDTIYLDEAQDTNAVQRALIRRMLKPNGRLIAVGDESQSIFNFRGASSDAMELIEKEFGCEPMPLTISYRCPKAVVREAQKYDPSIEASETAIEGEVRALSAWKLTDFSEGDAVLCRLNAPLMGLVYRLIGAKVKARILGRDIGKGLTSLIKKMKAKNLDDLVERLERYRQREVEKHMRKRREMQAQSVSDKVDSIIVAIDSLSEEEIAKGVPALIASIETLFADDRQGVTLSTVHKAKGKEWNTVYILDPGLMPSKWAKQPHQIKEEIHIQFVATTRAKQRLFYINSADANE